MTSKYQLVAGAKPKEQRPPRSYNPTREILQGITSEEKTVADLRRQQRDLTGQMARQRVYLDNPQNRHDDPALYRQRLSIHRDRRNQHAEAGSTASRLLALLDTQIENLEGPAREEGFRRLLSWSEPPF